MDKCKHCGKAIDAYVKWPYYRHEDGIVLCNSKRDSTKATPERENP